VNSRTKFNRFTKWHRMIYSRILSYKNTPEVKFLSRQNSKEKICNINNYEGKSIEEPKNFELSPVHMRRRKVSHGPSVLSIYDMNENEETMNKIEEGLRGYCKMRREKFLERVSKGPPDSFRWSAYMVAVFDGYAVVKRSEHLYNSLLKLELDEKTDNQIRKDLNRTLSDEPSFNLSDTQLTLYRLLKCFAGIDDEVGYCQGMNFISGFILLLADFNEVDSLYMLIALFGCDFNDRFNLRGFYLNDFPLLKMYLYIFDHYFEKRMPALRKHFEDLEIIDEIWVAKWFQTLYTINLPLNVVVRLWDCIIVYGLQFLINFTLAFLKTIEDDLIKATDTMDIVNYFKMMISPDSNRIGVNVEHILSQAKKIHIRFDDLRMQYEAFSKTNMSMYYRKYKLDELDLGMYIFTL
jgi:hypothetical protein